MDAQRFSIPGAVNTTLYSSSVRYGDLIWTAGHTAADDSGPMPDEFAQQVRLTLDHLEAALVAAGGGLDTLIKVTTFLTDFDDFAVYNEIYIDRFKGLGLPARATVQVARFPGNLQFEMEAVAHVRIPPA